MNYMVTIRSFPTALQMQPHDDIDDADIDAHLYITAIEAQAMSRRRRLPPQYQIQIARRR